MLQRPIRVVQLGLGAIGLDIARLIAQQPGLELVGGIEQDPAKIGADLGELIGLPQPLRVAVRDDADVVLRQARPDVVVIATAPLLRAIVPQLRACFDARAHVVSTCEELVYPFDDHPTVATSIDEEARAAGVSVLGVGVNPGFAMDFLPIFLTGPSSDVQKVSVHRAVNASTRRWTHQQRLGVGLDRAAFRDWARQRDTPHIGLRQSLQMIASALGWRLDHINEGIEPIIAEQWVETPHVCASPGQVAGIHQWAHGIAGHHIVIDLEWRSAVGLAETYDRVQIEGVPPLDIVIHGGIHGDHATSTLVTRSIPGVIAARPGLRTVLDLPVAHYQALPRTQPEQIAAA